MLRQFQYLAPETEEELLKILSLHKEKAKILAGGTNLLVDIRSDLLRPEYVVDVKNIPGVKNIGYSHPDGIYIGACVTCNALIESETGQENPLLMAAAKELASYQIRNRATVVGNICYASPAADMAPALLVLEAEVLVLTSGGEKKIAIKDFFKGVKKAALAPHEFVKAIIIPSKNVFMKGGYEKSKRVKGHDLSIVSVAMGKKNGTMRVAIGSCSPTPVLLGDFSSESPVSEIITKAMASVFPIDDLRGSADYRKHMLEVYIKKLYEKLGGEK